MTGLDQDLIAVIEALRRSFLNSPPSRTFDSWSTPAMNVLDCVLSLNRQYYAFCEPRLDRFAKAHPEVQTTGQLLERYPTALKFSIAELDYADEQRAGTLVGVTTYLSGIQANFFGDTESHRLHRWAGSVTPKDYTVVGVRGFGLAGFQYLRMLFGVNTAKPDVHIKRFISDAVGRNVSDARALELLENAAESLGWSLLALDNEVWELRTRSGRL